MKQYIKDFLNGMIATFYRMIALIAIPTGVYILCILHTASYVWLGIIGFFVAVFLIALGVVVTWLFGWYDRIMYEDSQKLNGRLYDDGNI